MSRPLEARPEILDRIPKEGHLVLEASAGTGKTYTLEHLVLQMILEEQVELQELLVVTFTEKATEELRSRLRQRLVRLARADPEELEDARWRLDPEQRRRLDECLARLDDLHISTIHGFCQGLLHDLAFRHRRLFQQELVDGDRLRREAFLQVFRSTLGSDSLLGRATETVLRDGASVTDLQDLVVQAAGFRGEIVTPRWQPEGLAGLVRDVTEALQYPACGSLGAGDTRDRIANLLESLPEPGDSLAVGTAWYEAERSRSSRDLRRALERDGSAEARALLADLEALDERAGEAVSLVASGYRGRTLEAARDRKATRGWYDFDDMLELVAEAVTRTGGDVAREVRARFRCALVDEFQDTDPVQWEIFSALFPPGDPDHRLVLIGDPKQSIYGFRNADLAVYQRACAAIRTGGGALLALDENFRSTPPMLDALDRIFRDFFDPGIEYQTPRAGSPELRLEAVDETEPAPVVLFRPYRPGRDGALPQGDFNRTLLAEIVDEIGRIVEGKSLRLGDAGDEPLPLGYRDVQILTRRNREVADVADALAAAGVPYTVYRQDGLFQTEEAGHVHSLLLAVSRPRDRGARLNAWLTPFFEVPLRRIPDARDAPGDHPVHSVLGHWQELARQGDLVALFRSLLRDSGLTRRLLFSRTEERALTNYEHVLEILTEEAHRGARTLPEIVALLADYRNHRGKPPGLEGNVQRIEGDRDAVQVLTMHKAKGLEAAVVFLYGGLWGRGIRSGDLNTYRRHDQRRAHLGRALPALAGEIDKEIRQEDQRLLYVASTRARARLYLPWAGPEETTAQGVHGLKKAPDGTYRQMEDRLTRLLADGDATPDGRLFEVRDVPCRAPQPAPGGPGDSRPGDLSRLEPALLRLEPPVNPDELARVRRARAGIIVTSYTRLSRHLDEPWGLEEEMPEDLTDEVHDGDETGPEALPGGLATGLFLHEVLERVDFEAVRAAPAMASWLEDRTASELVARAARRHGLEARHVPRAQGLVWNALRTPLEVGSLRLPRGLAAVERRVAEMEFLFPIPEPGHPLLRAPGSSGSDPLPYRVERGYLQGIVDLFFEHDGRYWFLDWKSDQRGDWSPESVFAHVDRHYDLQMRLYTLAVVRSLRVVDAGDYDRHFGGLLYCFLRGMGRNGGSLRGVYHHRPSWAEVVEWEEDLLRRSYPRAGGTTS